MNELAQSERVGSGKNAEPRDEMRPERDRERIVLWAAWATILALPLTFITMTVAAIALFYQVRDLRAVAARTEAQLVRSQLRIAYPKDGDAVQALSEVRGLTPYPNKVLYLVVATRGGEFLQDSKVRVTPAGTWSGQAAFGNASLVDGTTFIVRVAALERPLPSGVKHLPGDAIFSDPVTVKRVRQE